MESNTGDVLKPTDIARYELKGTHWKQGQCSYEEYCKAKQLVDKTMGEAKTASIAFMINDIVVSPDMPEIIKIILKPDTPNIFARLKQRFYGCKNKINLHNPTHAFQLWQLKVVLRDFFALNVAMMMNSIDTEYISTLTSTMTKAFTAILSDGKSPSSTSPMETSQTGKQ